MEIKLIKVAYLNVAKAVKDYNATKHETMPYFTMGDIALMLYQELPISDIGKKQKFSKKFLPKSKYEFTLTETINIAKILKMDYPTFIAKYVKVVYRTNNPLL